MHLIMKRKHRLPSALQVLVASLHPSYSSTVHCSKGMSTLHQKHYTFPLLAVQWIGHSANDFLFLLQNAIGLLRTLNIVCRYSEFDSPNLSEPLVSTRHLLFLLSANLFQISDSVSTVVKILTLLPWETVYK